MDSSGDGAILDFDLGELGMLARSGPDRDVESRQPSEVEAAFEATLAEFDRRVAAAGKTATFCVFRVGFGPRCSETVKTVVRTRTFQKMERSTREGDLCLRCPNGDVLLALTGCDVESARKSITLMMKLFTVENVHGPDDELKMSAGIAPYSGSAQAAQRTALLACDLASFQDNGYIEVVEF